MLVSKVVHDTSVISSRALPEDTLILDGRFRLKKLLGEGGKGLGAIHERGIVHRDLKPENVVLARSPDGEQARLLDFGIARLAESAPKPAGTGSVTQVGLVLGTPEYLSPEQALGQTLDARSD